MTVPVPEVVVPPLVVVGDCWKIFASQDFYKEVPGVRKEAI